MACQDCFNNCPEIISDKCVKYTGPDIDFLGIKSGDQLSALEAAIVSKLESVLSGVGISLSGLTDCDALKAAIGQKSPTLFNVVQALYTVVCTLREDVDTLQDEVSLPSSFDTSCLTGLPTSPTRDDILKGILDLLCSINTTVTTINNDYVTTSNVCSLVEDCLASTGTVQENAKMPKYVALPYHGPLSVFDASGAGISSAGYDKIYICLGQTVNGFTLPDYRGRSPIGVNSGIPTTGMDSSVDPSNVDNAGYSIGKNTKKGNFTNTLDSTQIPSHTHSVNDPGHSHMTPFFSETRPCGASCASVVKPTGGSMATLSSTTGITLNAAGGGQAHNTTHPVIGAVMIMYVP